MRKKINHFILLVLASALLFPYLLRAQQIKKEEYRATWIASVFNLDWPDNSNASVDAKINGPNGLIELLDDLKASGINSIFFQVRTQCDALYNSSYEPWSEFVSGSEGQNPGFDPLQTVLDEAHKRGMEVHAWFNPYRASVYSASGKAVVSEHPLEMDISPSFKAKSEGITPELAHSNDHVTNKHPEWILRVKERLILNPGLPEVKSYITDVVMDVVNNYDVDGVHFDDYFYPYPSNQVTVEDTATFRQYPRGFTDIGDWRRDNINRMVEMVADSIRSVKDYVKFGISPFGIWKSGVPSWLSGMNAFTTIYADALAWVADKSVDYMTPQTYWEITMNRFNRSSAQDFIGLTNWWADQMDGIHLYTGHGLYRSDGATFSGNVFTVNEMPNQVAHVQAQDDILGSVYFRADNLSQYNTQGFADSLKQNYYKYPSLPPRMEYRTDVAPATPVSFTATPTSEGNRVQLQWTDGGSSETSRYVVYRLDSDGAIDANAALTDPKNIVAITGETSYLDFAVEGSVNDYYYFVTEVNRVGEESAPSEVINAGQITSIEPDNQLIEDWKVSEAYPNPFNPVTNIQIQLSRASEVSVDVFNITGQKLANLYNGRLSIGEHPMSINAANWQSGIYFIRIQSDFGLQIRKITLVK